MFSAVLNGTAVDISNTRNAGAKIAESIAENGLSDWLTTVRRHHEGTYQHCLLVTGIAVDFGLSLGLSKVDVERLYSAAMFHDIGKAKIPLTVLDKPGRLDDHERSLIETHPAAGYEVLKGNPGISAEILDAVRHHHEYLDGSGYPDALCAESISDLVRVLTISDIFAALDRTSQLQADHAPGKGLRHPAGHAGQAREAVAARVPGRRAEQVASPILTGSPDR